MVDQDSPRLPSQLREGEWIELALEHTPNIRVQFLHEHGKLEAYVLTTLGNPEVDGCNVALTPEILDAWFLELTANRARIVQTNFLFPEQRKPWEI